MSIIQIKEALYKSIEEGDERFLRVMYAMATAYTMPTAEEITDKEIENIPPSVNRNSMSESELLSEFKKANEDISAGNYVTLEDLEKEMRQW